MKECLHFYTQIKEQGGSGFRCSPLGNKNGNIDLPCTPNMIMNYLWIVRLVTLKYDYSVTMKQ